MNQLNVSQEGASRRISFSVNKNKAKKNKKREKKTPVSQMLQNRLENKQMQYNTVDLNVFFFL